MKNNNLLCKLNYIKQTLDNFVVFESINMIDNKPKNLNIYKENNYIVVDLFDNDQLTLSFKICKKNKEQYSISLSYKDNNEWIDNKTIDIKNDTIIQPNQINRIESILRKKIQPLNKKAWQKYKEHQTLCETEKNNIEKDIFRFDTITKPIIKYVEYQNIGLVPSSIDNLKIINNHNGILVELYENNLLIGTFIFYKYYPNSDTRIFIIQYMDNNELTKTDPIGYSSNIYQRTVLERPNDIQIEILNKINEQVLTSIIPLNNSIKNLYHNDSFQYYINKRKTID